MSFSVVGSTRPLSARPRSARNPITGEDIPDRTPSRVQSRQQSRQDKPEGIPGLNLKYLKEADNYVHLPLEIADYPLDGGDTGRTDVSWGTDVNSARSCRRSAREVEMSARKGTSSRHHGMPALNLGEDEERYKKKSTQPKQPSAWDQPPVPDPGSCRPPSARHQQMYRQMEADRKDEYRNKGKVSEAEVAAAMQEVRERVPALAISEQDLVDHSWTLRQNRAAENYNKKMDAEELVENNKKLKLLETVMVDQLSRGVISDPEQNIRGQATTDARMPRGSNRSLHSSKVRTTATATENLLSKRVRFGARVLTRNGHDAIRELTGFFFSVDNSMTIYEFKQFGKTAKALPFINRGTFSHLSGPREGEPYTLVDICSGSELHIKTAGQHSLPETLKRLPEVVFMVTDVDEQEKRNILLHGVPTRDQDDVYSRLHVPNKQAYTEKMVLKSIQTNVQKKICKRAIRTITGLGRFYRKTDKSGSGVLYRFELEKGLFDFHIELPPDTLDVLFEILDQDETGELDYSVYMRAVLGSMIEARKSLVRKAFNKIDTGRKGHLTLNDIHKFFNSTFRPNKTTGQLGATGPLHAFLDAVVPNKKQEYVTYVEFEEYYEGLSLSLDSDEDFYSVLSNTWSI